MNIRKLRKISDIKELYKQGADYVILPKFISGEKASNLIHMVKKEKGKIKGLRKDHRKYLNSIDRLFG